MIHIAPLPVAATLLALSCIACTATPIATLPSSPAPTATPSSSPAPATSQPATAVIQPSPPPLTATPSPCLATVAPEPQPHRRPVRIVYADRGKLWRWEEETGTASPYLLRGEAHDARLSGDGRLIAFRRPVGERQQDEIWVVGADGSGERRLATMSAAETLERYPVAGGADLVVDWLPDAHILACYYEPNHTIVEYGPYEALWPVDADSGAVHAATTAADEVMAFAFAPVGGHVAALMAQELRLIDARDGQVRFRVPVRVERSRSQSLAYAPDGRYLAVFTEAAITIVSAADGSRRDIAFDYQPLGMGEYALLPRINWLDDGVTFCTAFQTDASLASGPDATFTLWRVDVATGTVEPLNTLQGSFIGSAFSPDRRWLAYPVHRNDNQDLYLADVQGGRQILYEQGGWVGLRGWNPGSVRFVYQEGKKVALGHICQAPQILQGVEPDPGLQRSDSLCWIDGERFLTVNGSYAAKLWTLRLNTLNGEVTIITALHAHLHRYGYYFAD